MLQLNNISIERNNNNIINSASAVAEKGSFIAITGPNGTGKSTLLTTIAGLYQPCAGNIILGTIDITHQSAKQRASAISLLQQDPAKGTIGSLTVEENLALAIQKGTASSLKNGLQQLAKHPIMKTFQELFANHEKLLKQKVYTLSGGQRQLLAAIIATATRPDVLLMDEPTAALSPAAAKTLMDFIESYRLEHSVTVLIVTHATNVATQGYSAIWQVCDGNINII